MSTICRVCGNNSELIFKDEVLAKYKVGYYKCPTCDFIQTETPFWMEEAYKSALNLSDTGIVTRNFRLSKVVTVFLRYLFKRDAKFIDYAGGYGLFTRMMRDIGFDYYWEDKFAANLLARGFEHKENQRYEALTAFEVMEHLTNPRVEIESMLKYSETIIFTTEIFPSGTVPERNWWYYGFKHGQHIAFYSIKTLNFIADSLGMTLWSNGQNIHMLTRKKVSKLKIGFLYKAVKYGLFYLAIRNVKSKTETDHFYLLNG